MRKSGLEMGDLRWKLAEDPRKVPTKFKPRKNSAPHRDDVIL
jgi:hypothetical protein